MFLIIMKNVCYVMIIKGKKDEERKEENMNYAVNYGIVRGSVRRTVLYETG